MESYPDRFKEKWYMIILMKNLDRREEGFWFYNKGIPTYITGTHYMYLQWSKIDVGQQTLEKQTDCSLYSGKLVKQIKVLRNVHILKTDGQDFLLWHQAKLVNHATISSDARFGVLSKSGADAKKMFTDKIVPISVNYPFFLQTHPRWYGST